MSNHSDELFAALQRLLPQHTLSRLIGKLATVRSPAIKNYLIRLFIKQYAINLAELEHANPENHSTFNDFFTRPLKSTARPVTPGDSVIVSPADGTISQIGAIHQANLIQAKGKTFSVSDLLSDELAAQGNFDAGLFTTIYLSPSDYHRVHMPTSGQLVVSRYIPGKLFSVNQITAQQIDGLFARNERLVCLFDTLEFGRCAVILVGAMLVAGIESAWHGDYEFGKQLLSYPKDSIAFEKGDEIGQFKFGSTVILLFEKNSLTWHSSFKPGDSIKMGQKIARSTK